ncbi:MAG TPA: MBL fold metallo-hydrolase [Opitutaceae bacterium]|nr:MBL fold metallo-hydrolase [Opitutaceae bacterium]
MARIPLEDNFDDVINKAQRGLNISDEDLAHRAQISRDDLASLKGGKFNEAVARRVASHLRLSRDALVELGQKAFYPEQPLFSTGFAAFNTPHEDMTVNSYVIWDERTKHAAVFDTGGTAEPILSLIESEKLRVRYIFLTHTHEDHIADLPRLIKETKSEVWTSELETLPDTKTFPENSFFHIGPFAIKTLFTNGHSPGGTTYYITGLSYPLAIVGDSLFSCSMGGAPAAVYQQAIENNRKKILPLPMDTVLACGHGPISTVAQEKKHNPFFAR